MSNRDTPPELDQIADVVLAYNPNKKSSALDEPDSPAVESWSTSIQSIFANSDVRLDATHFDLSATNAVSQLEASGYELNKLSDMVSVQLRNQFTRIWAKDSVHGTLYLNATDLLSLFALGVPAGGYRYLSHATETNIDALIVRKNWLLLTCSGTIGRVFHVPKRLDGWVATHDLIRIIPKSDIAGYLYAWLSTPIAQAQILSHTHGGQIDHVTDAQVSDILVPRLPGDEEKAINKAVTRALLAREKAIETLANAWPST